MLYTRENGLLKLIIQETKLKQTREILSFSRTKVWPHETNPLYCTHELFLIIITLSKLSIYNYDIVRV